MENAVPRLFVVTMSHMDSGKVRAMWWPRLWHARGLSNSELSQPLVSLHNSVPNPPEHLTGTLYNSVALYTLPPCPYLLFNHPLSPSANVVS